MKITYITAGAGLSYCGACVHDMLIVRKLMVRGNKVQAMPLYTPVKVDFEVPDIKEKRIFFSGINTFLRQNFSFLEKSNLGRAGAFFERPGVLNFFLKFAVDIAPEKLGSMTVDVLKGENGKQSEEIKKIIEYLKKK